MSAFDRLDLLVCLAAGAVCAVLAAVGVTILVPLAVVLVAVVAVILRHLGRDLLRLRAESRRYRRSQHLVAR